MGKHGVVSTNSMFDKMFRKNIVETEFGPMNLQKDSDIFYFEKFIEFGSNKKILLTVESNDKNSISRQFSLYNLISSNAEQLIQAAGDFYKTEHQTELYKDWEIESIIMQ